METNFTLKGRSIIILHDKDGNILDKRENPNAVVNVGKWAIGQRVGGTASMGQGNAVAIGTGTLDGAQVTYTELAGLIGIVKAGSFSQNSDENSWQVVATWTTDEPNVSAAITESGVYFGTAHTWMLCRQTFDVVNKTTNDTLTITWQFSVS